MKDHEQIWLEPKCPRQPECYGGGDGRLWCEDPIFESCAECGAKPVRYVLQQESGE